MYLMKNLVVVLFLIPLILIITFVASSDDHGFIYNGFKDDTDLSLDGLAGVTPNGLLRLTNATKYQTGHAFYKHPFQFKKYLNSTTSGNTSSNSVSFSTTFVFAIVKESDINGQGFTFVIAPQRGLPGSLANQFLGLFNGSSNGKFSNHVVAVELDTNVNVEYDKITGNHVGIDINDLNSVKYDHPKYFTNGGGGGFKDISLTSGEPIQVWVEYEGEVKQLNVTLAPAGVQKPNVPLLSLSQDLSTIFLDSMYVGFSASTQTATTFHYIFGWSFQINGVAQALDFASLPHLPHYHKKKLLKYGLPVILPVFTLLVILIIFVIHRKRKFSELVEDWELIYGTHRFHYKDLYNATKGFSEKEVIGSGAFGKVYRGVLPTSKIEVAIKKVSHDSTRGIQQFVAEIVSIGKLRHRNLVQLFGYCRRKGELLLVYDYMPYGSLDKFLFGRMKSSSSAMLNWRQRFQIIKGVGSVLFYLHEECKKVVIHRDIKASNVLLDGEMNARLGDFGLAMLFDHGTSDAPTSRVVGTPGYLAPEMSRTGMASTSTDVYAYGVFLLEVACGKRPVELKRPESGHGLVYLVDWVLHCWRKGAILQTSDPNLGSEYVVEEMELVLKLGLLCAHSDPEFRPSMRKVMQYLNGDASLVKSDLWALDKCDTINQAFTRVEKRLVVDSPGSSSITGSLSSPSGSPNVSVPSGSS